MTARFHTRSGMKVERLSRLPSPPRIHRAAHIKLARGHRAFSNPIRPKLSTIPQENHQ